MHSLLFLGGLLGPKPPISPGMPPYCLCRPATGIGSAPFLSACILGAVGGFGIESTECLLYEGCPLPPFAPAYGENPLIATGGDDRVPACSVRGVGGVVLQQFPRRRHCLVR